MALLADLEDFVCDHRLHGTMIGDATEPAWNGYLLTVACPWGVVFERWVTPDGAESDLRLLAREQCEDLSTASQARHLEARPMTGWPDFRQLPDSSGVAARTARAAPSRKFGGGEGPMRSALGTRRRLPRGLAGPYSAGSGKSVVFRGEVGVTDSENRNPWPARKIPEERTYSQRRATTIGPQTMFGNRVAPASWMAP